MVLGLVRAGRGPSGPAAGAGHRGPGLAAGGLAGYWADWADKVRGGYIGDIGARPHGSA